MSRELIGGRYLRRRAIGRGGMGTVWLCTDQTLHRDVAVKRMGLLAWDTSAGTARAMREARLAAAMNHRNAVSVFDVVEHDDAPWLVMEYFPSRTLDEIIREDGPLWPDRAGHIAAQVAKALAAAHKLGIVHRDGNILVGDGDYTKLSDFGIARAEMDATLTQTGMMTGTPAYLPPELATGDGPSPASDVWALGATVYAAVEGLPPFGTHGNALQLLSRIVHDPVPRPNHAGPLEPVLRDLLAKDPRVRPTMSEAATLLADPPERLPAAPVPPTASMPPASPPRPDPTPGHPDEGGGRRRLVPAGLAILLVVGLVVGGWALLRGGGDEDAANPPQERATGSTDAPPRNTQPSQTQPSRTPPSESETTEPAADDPAEFVETYYAAMPGDTDTGWSMLGGSLKSQGKSSYEDFWSTIQQVQVSNVTVESPTSVMYDITYIPTNGEPSSEQKRITLESHGDGYRIVDDEQA